MTKKSEEIFGIASAVESGHGRLYKIVEDYLFSQIKSGKLKPSMSIGSVSDLAKELNVSVSTVQQSLQTLAAKGIVIRKPRIGTIINPSLSCDISNSHESKTVSLIVPDIVRPEYVMLLRAFQDVCLDFGFDVVCSSTDGIAELYNSAIMRQIDAKPFGIVLVPPFEGAISLDVIVALEKSGIPIISCFRPSGLLFWPLITNDVVFESYIITRHLCEVGCKNIAFLGAEYPTEAGLPTFHQEGHFGYIKALFDCNMVGSIDLFNILSLDDQLHYNNVKSINEFIKKHPEVDGICCSSDSTAAIVIRELERMGRRVPQEIAVAGAGNYGRYLGFEAGYITTTSGLVEKLAKRACELIDSKRKGDAFTCGLRVAVKSELLPGWSTAYKRKASVGCSI